MPTDCHGPQTLQSHLCGTNRSLSDKVIFAKQLATSVSYLHVLNYVHKGIRPETALILQADDSRNLHLFLVWFKTFRTAEGKTMRLGNSDWAENIYQHPERQGNNPIADYTMQHDIYSLVVCLLDIGLWEPFITGEGHINIPTVYTKIDISTFARNGAILLNWPKPTCLPNMADKYAQDLVNCLTCMDDANEDMEDLSQFEDEDGIFIGVKFIKKV
ncbi:hypothetical protein N7517_003896 [Penicillium concentricum]|uniref:Protein kinase domain-containing protein n=1 Tax=Penicillium concentricum TaxID=293559 RepID=A0A9W9VA09_9EURO|nr:uncharacterized protein N7517_003896 [Penicillium concentricum]KAJ5371890.1 hypothetical protein N7517_003896 [Penicillium concentricum]